MQPSTSYYSPRFPTMLQAPPQSTPITHSSHPQPHYAHPQYAPIHQSPTTTPHHQYVYPSTYPQSPYLPSQYPVQQVHVLPQYMTRPQMQPAQPMHHLPVQQYVVSPKETPERDTFYAKLHAFRDHIGEPIQRLPTLGFKELDLCILYKEVTKRRGIDSVIANKQWKEVAEALQLPSSCTDSGFRLRLHYKKYLEAFERKFYRAPPTKEVNKQAKKLERASSMMSTDSTVTEVAGENSGSSATRRSSGPGSSSDSMIKVVRKKKRSDAKIEQDKGKKESDGTAGVEKEKENEKAEAKHNLRILEAAVMAVDGNGKICKKKKKKREKVVDFSVLDNATLKRYAKAYDMCAPSNELAESVSAHFSETPLAGGEHETVVRFIETVRRVVKRL